MARRYPALADGATYAAFLRKWEYLFAYAGAGFAKGYITCHMLTLVRAVSPLPLRCDATLLRAAPAQCSRTQSQSDVTLACD